jgi:hypothetical protein
MVWLVAARHTGAGAHDGLVIVVAVAGLVGEPLPYVEHPDIARQAAERRGLDGGYNAGAGLGRG